MIWICRLLCPKGHVMAAGATEANSEDQPILARSFVNFLYSTMPIVTCERGCYRIDLRKDCVDLDVHVESAGFQTLEDAEAVLKREAAEFRTQEFLHRRRN